MEEQVRGTMAMGEFIGKSLTFESQTTVNKRLRFVLN